jgi:hypothetical protein
MRSLIRILKHFTDCANSPPQVHAGSAGAQHKLPSDATLSQCNLLMQEVDEGDALRF